MAHPRPNHLYTVKQGGVFQGNFAWTPGDPPTYTLWDSEGEIIYTGPYEGDPPHRILVNGTTGLACGYVDESTDPDGAVIWCDCWQEGATRTLHH